MEVWIQKHDYHIDGHSGLDRDQCLALLDSFDWESELASYEEALERNQDRCPPGMGFVDGDRALHVMPIHDGKSIRRDCARCGRFIGFPVWYGGPGIY